MITPMQIKENLTILVLFLLISPASSQITITGTNQTGAVPFTPTWTRASGSSISGLAPTVANGNFGEYTGANANNLTKPGIPLTIYAYSSIQATNLEGCGNDGTAGLLLVYTLPASTYGYNITNITVYGGWQEVSKGETYLFAVEPLYAQWLTDIQDDQHSDGSVSDVSPAYWPLYQDGTVWASTYIIIPDMLYDQYDDLGILQQHYASMKNWTDHMTKYLEDDIMPRNTYEDWCFPPKAAAEMTVINSKDPQLTTSGVLMSTAVFYHDLCLMAESARRLGKIEDAEHFEALAAKMKVLSTIASTIPKQAITIMAHRPPACCRWRLEWCRRNTKPTCSPASLRASRWRMTITFGPDWWAGTI